MFSNELLFLSPTASWPEIGKRALFVPEDHPCQALGGKGGERDRHECCGRDRDGGHGALHLIDLRKGVERSDHTEK